MTPNEPGVVLFRVDGLQCQVYSNAIHAQSLHIKITPGMMQDMKPAFQWNMDDLQVMEQYFEMKVASPPYRQASLCSFLKMFNVPALVLKDIIQIVRLELKPEMGMNLKWSVQFCLRAPPSISVMVPVGTSSIVSVRSKFLFFVS